MAKDANLRSLELQEAFESLTQVHDFEPGNQVAIKTGFTASFVGVRPEPAVFFDHHEEMLVRTGGGWDILVNCELLVHDEENNLRTIWCHTRFLEHWDILKGHQDPSNDHD